MFILLFLLRLVFCLFFVSLDMKSKVHRKSKDTCEVSSQDKNEKFVFPFFVWFVSFQSLCGISCYICVFLEFRLDGVDVSLRFVCISKFFLRHMIFSYWQCYSCLCLIQLLWYVFSVPFRSILYVLYCIIWIYLGYV